MGPPGHDRAAVSRLGTRFCPSGQPPYPNDILVTLDSQLLDRARRAARAPHLAVLFLEPQLADAQHYQDTDDHEEAAEQDGRSDLKPFVKAMAHPGDGVQGRDPSRHPAVES